jgi:molecular chaperone Hsp33
MPETTPPNSADAGLELHTKFVRHRHALLARANFGELFVDYYLHLGAHQLKPAPEHDAMFKRALAAFVLHCASRPRPEHIAWTVNFQSPRVNLFLTADNETGAVTRPRVRRKRAGAARKYFLCRRRPGGQPKRRSAVNFAGADPLAAVERFYAQSEQRGARYFELGEEEFALLTEHPDCDLAWFRGLDAPQVRALETAEDPRAARAPHLSLALRLQPTAHVRGPRADDAAGCGGAVWRGRGD